MNLEQTVLQVPIEDIIPNRFQPRLTFDEQGLQELAASIKEHGIIQPLVLRKLGDKYEIIAGERRYKAAGMAGLSTVPAVIANIDDNASAEVALVENVQRRDLTAIEEARSYKNLLDKGYLTQEQLAKRMGLSQPAIANKLRLLNLDEEVQQALLDEKISERHARTLLTLPDKEAQKEWLHRIINERMTVRQLDLELKQLRNQGILAEQNADIPLVTSVPSIEDIKANAVDIKDIGKQDSGVEELETLDVMADNNIDSLDTGMIDNTIDNTAVVTDDLIENNEEGVNPKLNMDLNMNMNMDMNNYNQQNGGYDMYNGVPMNQPMAPQPQQPMPPQDQQGFITATSVPEFNIATPQSASTFISNDNYNQQPPQTATSFFNTQGQNYNQMQNQYPEQAQMPPMNPTMNQGNNPQAFDTFGGPQSNNAFVNVSEAPSSNEDVPVFDFTKPPIKPAFETEINTTNTMINPNNRFFTPIQNNNNQSTMSNMSAPGMGGQETEVDPMAAVANLTGTSATGAVNTNKKDIKFCIDTVRGMIQKLGDDGFFIEVEEIDFPSSYEITMKIHKDE